MGVDSGVCESKRNQQKRALGRLNELCIEAPWLLVGDFNYVLRAEERSSDGGALSSFMEWVGSKGLIDLGYVGPKFT